MSAAAAIATISPSSTSVTVDMGRLNTVPRQAQRIARLFSTLCRTPTLLTAITTSVTRFAANGWKPVTNAAPSSSSMKGYTYPYAGTRRATTS